jgi:hypothetical protein
MVFSVATLIPVTLTMRLVRSLRVTISIYVLNNIRPDSVTCPLRSSSGVAYVLLTENQKTEKNHKHDLSRKDDDQSCHYILSAFPCR